MNLRWCDTPDGEQGALVDKLFRHVRKAVKRAGVRLDEGRPKLAARAIRQAATYLAAASKLGWESPDLETKARAVAKRAGVTIE